MYLQGNIVENYGLKHHSSDEYSSRMQRNEQVKKDGTP
jgi:hypothetical protein